MNKIASLMLAGAAGLVFSGAPAWAAGQDSASYKDATDKAAADYRSAAAQCDTETGHARQVCLQQAKVARAQAEVDAADRYRNTPREMRRARTALANAEYNLSKAKCGDKTGSDKTGCLREAKAAQVAALNEARSGTSMAAREESATSERRETAGTATLRENCDQLSGSDKAACIARNSASATRDVVADTAITTRVKADLVREPDLKAMDVHVETVKGVVMLSGFVESQKEADKAVAVARSVDGVTDVKSALKVK